MELRSSRVQFPLKENKVEEPGWEGEEGETDGCVRLAAATPAPQEPRGARTPPPPASLRHRPGTVMMRFQALSQTG